MSVREFLAKHAATRVAAMATVLCLLGAAVGCSSTVNDQDIERGIDHPGRDAATIAEARAINLRDEIDRLKHQREELEVKRSDCMALAASYHAKEVAVWSDPSVSEKERPSVANQFDSMAAESEAAAYRYGQVSDACATRIDLLEGERHDQLRRVERYEKMIVPKPELE